MKYNYLVSSYNNTMMKYKKYFSRLQRDINNGSFVKLSAKRKNFLVRKVDELRARLASMQPKLAGVIAGAGLLLALNTPQAQAQFVLNQAKNPFGSADITLIPFAHNYSSHSSPVLIDIDGDGDKDAVVGSNDKAEYFKNTGTNSAPIYTSQTGTNNPFPNLATGGYYSNISIADLDNDGDFDLIVGAYDLYAASYQILYFQNTGTSTAPAFTQLTGTDNPIPSTTISNNYVTIFPALVDIDGDGDKDILVGFSNQYGTKFLENTGTPSAPIFVEQASSNNPINTVTAYGIAIPSFVDIDGDGDFDLVVSNTYNSLSFYKNTGTATAALFTAQTGTNNPFDTFTTTAHSLNASFADVDGDGDKDMLVGGNEGKVEYYKNNGTASAPFFNIHPKLYISNYSRINFADMDGDGDKDAFFSGSGSIMTYAQNNGPASAPVFVVVTGTSNPFNNIYSPTSNAVTDLDGDGDLDLMIKTRLGDFNYYKNTGTATAAVFASQTGTDNPMDGQNNGAHSTATFADVDGDGDQDIISGAQDGTVVYFKNTGTTSAAVFVQQTGTYNPFNAVTSGTYSCLAFGDADGDSDLDLVIGTGSDGAFYYKNTGTPTAPVYTAQTGTNNPFNSIPVMNSGYYGPAFMDIDNDGDLDLFVSDDYGYVNLYENIPAVVTPPTTATSSATFSEAVSAYPNPVKDVLNFSVNDAIGSNMKVSVLDMAGSEMLTQSFENSGATMSINVSSLNAGIYVLKLSSDAKAGVVKFVKQ